VRIVFAITRAASVDETWTTVHLARIALRRGHAVRFVEPWDFEIDTTGRIVARAHAFDAPTSAEELAAALVYRRADRRYVDLERADLLLLRAAPLDVDVLTVAQLAQDRGVEVVNDPKGLVRVAHKGWVASLADVPKPPTVVTRSRSTAQLFYANQPDGVIVKPARGSGGRHVSRVHPYEGALFDEAFDLARVATDGYVVVQAYVDDEGIGEKRLVWLDGSVVGGYLRRRAPGEFRHNLKRGGQAEPIEITQTDRQIGRALAPHLLAAGVRLAGLDVIGSHVIEVNTLNPGGAFHTDRLCGTSVGEQILDRLTAGVAAPPHLHAVPAP
jgi:glutathione synthase